MKQKTNLHIISKRYLVFITNRQNSMNYTSIPIAIVKGKSFRIIETFINEELSKKYPEYIITIQEIIFGRDNFQGLELYDISDEKQEDEPNDPVAVS